MKRASSSEPSTSSTPAKRPLSMNTGFSAATIPAHHYHLGEDSYAVVSDFGNTVNVHIRKYRTNDDGLTFPTKQGVSVSPFIWMSLVAEMTKSFLPSDTTKVLVLRDSLLLSTAWIDDEPFVSFQRYITKADFSRHFLPSVCLVSEKEWDRLQSMCKRITDSCKTLLFTTILRSAIRKEAEKRSPPSNVEMELEDAHMILSSSLTEILSESIKDRIHDVMVCRGCVENQANQLGHECITYDHDQKPRLYGDLALVSIDMDLVAQDFVQKNIQMLNYVNDEFLMNFDANLIIKSACDLYITTDNMYRMH